MITPAAWRRKRLRKESLKTLSSIQNPKHSSQFWTRAQSPWVSLIHYFVTLAQLILLMLLFGYVNQFADFIDGRGEYRNRIENEQRLATCYLISSLEADEKGQLQALAERLGCEKGPIPSEAPPEPVDPGSTIAPGAGNFTGDAAPGSQTDTVSGSDDDGGRAGVAADPPPTAETDQMATTVPLSPDAPQSSVAPTPESGAGATPVQFCLPMTSVCFPF